MWEGFPTLAYNSAQNEYTSVTTSRPSSGASSVGTQRVKPGTGALIGGRSTLYSGGFNQYPELAYNSATNQYLAISWGYSGASWMLRGRLADGNSQPLGASTLALAAKGGGDGIGLGYNPVSNTYLADYQSQTNAETWGVEIGAAGAPGTQIQLSVTGTTQSVQPRAKAETGDDRWLMVTSNAFKNIIAQVVGHGLTAPAGGGTGTGRHHEHVHDAQTGCEFRLRQWQLASWHEHWRHDHRWLHDAIAWHGLYLRERQLAPADARVAEARRGPARPPSPRPIGSASMATGCRPGWRLRPPPAQRQSRRRISCA